MKKIISAFIPLMMFSLVGCNKSSAVTYKEISEDQFNAYYTDEKKEEAIDKLDSYSTYSVNYKSEQKFNDGKIYGTKEILQVAENYAYDTKRNIDQTIEEPTDKTTTELVLATFPDTSGSYCYGVVYDNLAKEKETQSLLTGEQAFNRYGYYENMLRTIEKAQVENPIATKLSDISYYKGSDGTLKVISQNSTGTMVYTYVIDAKTLFLKYHSLHEEGSNYVLNQESVYKQNIKISHKTPKDIGFEG